MTTTAAGQSTQLLADVVVILDQNKIAYAVIGALAAAVHGVVRASIDADAVIAAAPPELRALQTKLVSNELTVQLRTGGVDDPIGAMLIVTDRHGNRVDLLSGIYGMDGGVYQRTVTLQPSGIPVPLKIAGREDFIAMKFAAGGPKDLLDAENCIAVSGQALNVELIRRLARQFGRDALSRCDQLLPK